MRHTVADSKSFSGRDIDRQLTADGARILRDVLDRARVKGLAPHGITSSPYARAAQSAAIAAEVLGFREPIFTSGRIVPDSHPSELWQEVRERAVSPLLLVSHEPLLSAAVSWLTGETRVIIEFKPATIVRIDFDGVGYDELAATPRGRLIWKIDGN